MNKMSMRQMRYKQNRKRWNTRIHRDRFDALCKIISMEIHIYFHYVISITIKNLSLKLVLKFILLYL